MEKLGRLERLELRTAWRSESIDFTPWLAQPENLDLLSESIGMDLLCIGREKRVGPYRADLLCKDRLSEEMVLIENQLEGTDHKHLGQLLTYAAGLETVTMVWVAESFSAEHRAAIDWLNANTKANLKFFGLELELWRIDESAPALRLNPVCKPNKLPRVFQEAIKSTGATDTTSGQLFYIEYWSAFMSAVWAQQRMFLDRHRDSNDLIKNYLTFPLSSKSYHLHADIKRNTQWVYVGLTFKSKSGRDLMDDLLNYTKEFEELVQSELEWERTGERGYLTAGRRFDLENRGDWPQQHRWMAETLARFYTAVCGRIRNVFPVE